MVNFAADPTEAQLAWQIFTSLAYGAKDAANCDTNGIFFQNLLLKCRHNAWNCP